MMIGLAVAEAAFAQGRPSRGQDVLLATVTVRGSANGLLGENETNEGISGNGDTQLTVAFRPSLRRVQLQMGGTTGLRYLGTRDEWLPIGHTGGITFGLPIGRRTSIRAMANAGYIPTFSLVGEPSIPIETLMENPGLLPSVTIDYSLVRRVMYRTGADLSLTHQFRPGTSFTVGGTYDRMTFADKSDPSMGGLNGSARLNHRLTRYLGFHAGYTRRESLVTQRIASPVESVIPESEGLALADGPATTLSVDTDTPVVIEDLDVGLDFLQARSLRLSRKTTLNFSTGSSLVQVDRRPRQIGLTAQASLSYLASASATAALNYSRGVQMVPGISRPVFADTLSVNGVRTIGRRFQLSANSAYSLGHAGDTVQNRGRISNLSGSARAAYTFSERGRLSLDYLVTRHRLGQDVDVVDTVPRFLFRHSLRMSLSFAIPLVRDLTPVSGR